MPEGQRVALKPFAERHLAATLDWVNDAETARLIDHFGRVSPSEHQEWYERVTSDSSQAIFAIETRPEGTHVGNCGLREIDRRSKKAKLWIYLGREFTKRGYGKEATQLLLRYAFDSLNLNRVYLYVLDFNKRARRLYESLGFEVEGTFREDAYVDGAYVDTIWMGLLRDRFDSATKHSRGSPKVSAREAAERRATPD